MRLDSDQKAALEYALADVEGEVYLFGSRAEKGRKGGDVDILIFTKRDPYQLSREVSVKYFSKCEEKIDVVVMDKDNLTEEQEAFLRQQKRVRYK